MKTQIKLIPTLISATALMSCGGANTDANETTGTPYPLETCLVADKKLGSMGKPHTFVHEGRQIKYCCIGCDDEFQANTAKYLKKFDDAVAANAAGNAAAAKSEPAK